MKIHSFLIQYVMTTVSSSTPSQFPQSLPSQILPTSISLQRRVGPQDITSKHNKTSCKRHVKIHHIKTVQCNPIGKEGHEEQANESEHTFSHYQESHKTITLKTITCMHMTCCRLEDHFMKEFLTLEFVYLFTKVQWHPSPSTFNWQYTLYV